MKRAGRAAPHHHPPAFDVLALEPNRKGSMHLGTKSLVLGGIAISLAFSFGPSFDGPDRTIFPSLIASGASGPSNVASGCNADGRTGFDTSEQNGKGTDGGSGDFGESPGEGLELEPKNVTVVIDTATTPPTPGAVLYALKRRLDGGVEDVTVNATLTLDDATVGSFDGASFIAAPSLPDGVRGKSTTVVADTATGRAFGTLTVVQLRKTGEQRDFFFVLPYQGMPAPTRDVLKFSTNIKQADVAFVVDTTASMQSSIDHLKTALQGSLLKDLRAAIPNVGLAFVDHKDFTDGNAVIKVRQVVTSNLSLALAAVGAMSAGGGDDLPEAQIAAMQYALLGTANGSIAAHTSAPGTFGGVDFRPGSVPVIVEVTDAAWHDPSGDATMQTLKSAFAATRARFVDIANNESSEAQADELSDATGSNVPVSAFGGACGGACCTGAGGGGRAPTGPGGTCRLNFQSTNGNAVSSGIVSAIQAIAVGSTFDVHATITNDAKNPNGVDATKFVAALRAMDEGDAASGCPKAVAKDSNGDGIKDTFSAVKAGTPVCFEVIPNANTVVPATLAPQFFNAFVHVVGMPGDLPLDERSVLFLVPPKDPVVK